MPDFVHAYFIRPRSKELARKGALAWPVLLDFLTYSGFELNLEGKCIREATLAASRLVSRVPGRPLADLTFLGSRSPLMRLTRQPTQGLGFRKKRHFAFMCCADGFVHERIVDAQHAYSSNVNIDFFLKTNGDMVRCPFPESTSSGAQTDFHLLFNTKVPSKVVYVRRYLRIK